MNISCAGRFGAVLVGCVLLPWLSVLAAPSVKDAVKPAKVAPPARPSVSDQAPPGALPEPFTFNPNPTSLQQGPTEIWAVAFAPDGNTLAIATGGGNGPGALRLWDLPAGKERANLQESKPIRSVAYAHNGKIVATAEFDNTAKLRDPVTGQVLRVLRGHQERVNGVSFSPDDQILATAGLDKTIKLWDTATGKELATLGGPEGHTDWVLALAFSPDGKTLASSGKDMTARLWDLGRRKGPAAWKSFVPHAITLRGHNNFIDGIAFSPDGKMVATGSWDSTAKVWDAATGKELATLLGIRNQVHCVAFSPDSKLLATGSADTQIKLWDLATFQEDKTLEGHQQRIYSVAFSPDGKRLASGSWDKTVKLWDVDSGTLLQTLEPPDSRHVVLALTYSPDGKTIAMACEDKEVLLLDAATGRILTTFHGHEDVVAGVAFSPDGKTLASAGFDRTVRLWDVAAGKQRALLRGHRNWVFCVAFSPDGKTLASGSYDKIIKLWDPVTGKEKQSLRGHTAAVRSLAFAPDGKTLASGSSDRTVRLWDLATSKETSRIKGHKGVVRALAFTPDGRLLASGSEDQTVKLWEMPGGKERSSLNHLGEVGALAFSRTGKTLVGAGRSLQVWDPSNGVSRAVLPNQPDTGTPMPQPTVFLNLIPIFTSLAFSPRADEFCAATYDKRVQRWKAERPPKPPQQKTVLLAMETVARSIQAHQVERDTKKQDVETAVALQAKPLVTYGDPQRQVPAGAVWAWGSKGRPQALLAMEYNYRPASRSTWGIEFISLTSGKFVAKGKEGWQWLPQPPGLVVQPITNAPAPAATAASRLSQMTGLADRFMASEIFGVNRMLPRVPQPVYRYADPAAGLVDGALFFFSYGGNPEVLLVMEARQKGASAPVWEYGLARLSSAELHVSLDKREVWTQPSVAPFRPDSTYWIRELPATISGPMVVETPVAGKKP